MRARYYNVDIKRFVNQDVLTGSIDSSPSLNRYAYVEGNPVSFLDPFGLEPLVTDSLHNFATGVSFAGGVVAIQFRLPEIGFSMGAGATFFDIGVSLNDIITSNFDIEVVQSAVFSALENIGWFILGAVSFTPYGQFHEPFFNYVNYISTGESGWKLLKEIINYFWKG